MPATGDMTESRGVVWWGHETALNGKQVWGWAWIRAWCLCGFGQCVADTAWNVPWGSIDSMLTKGPKRLNFTSTWTQEGFEELRG